MKSTTTSPPKRVQRTVTVGRGPDSRDSGTDSSLAKTGHWGAVANRVAEKARIAGFPVAPGTAGQWIAGSSHLTPAKRVALIITACHEIGDQFLLSQVMAPIRAAELAAPLAGVSGCFTEVRESYALVEYQSKVLPSARKALQSSLAWAAHASMALHRALEPQ